MKSLYKLEIRGEAVIETIEEVFQKAKWSVASLVAQKSKKR